MKAWPFLEQAQPLRMLMETLQRVGPDCDLECYRVFFRYQPSAAQPQVAEMNLHGIDGVTVSYEHFFELNPLCGLNLDSLLATGHLPGWQRVALALADALSIRGSEGPHKRRRREDDDDDDDDDDESDTGAGGSRSSGPALPGN